MRDKPCLFVFFSWLPCSCTQHPLERYTGRGRYSRVYWSHRDPRGHNSHSDPRTHRDKGHMNSFLPCWYISSEGHTKWDCHTHLYHHKPVNNMINNNNNNNRIKVTNLFVSECKFWSRSREGRARVSTRTFSTFKVSRIVEAFPVARTGNGALNNNEFHLS